MKKQFSFFLLMFVLLICAAACNNKGENETPAPKVDSVLTFNVNGVTFKMIHVDSCTFTMGAKVYKTFPELNKDAAEDEKPAHKVTLSGYYIGETEVTQELWLAVMGRNSSWCNGWREEDSCDYGTNLKRPMENISWESCQNFIKKLNRLTGKKFRLPTEAEWECAARGGNKSKGTEYSGSDDFGDVAWCEDITTHNVAAKAPNELGLYDMSGHVWECCEDWYGDYTNNAQTNPTGPSSGSERVVRGGGWRDNAWYCRVSYRSSTHAMKHPYCVGFRLAL